MTEELNELGDENIERSVESIRVQLIIAILTYLVQSTEGTLHREILLSLVEMTR